MRCFKSLDTVKFPKPSGTNINMMPIIMGEKSTIPYYAWGYLPIIEKCNLRKGLTVYLTINESPVNKYETQRRPGVHTDGTHHMGWGGGWGGNAKNEGIYMASTDGRCRVWNEIVRNSDRLGAIDTGELRTLPEILAHNTLYWLTDRTPHESLPSVYTAFRQFFRLVSEAVDVWYSRHSTPNPLGVLPNCTIINSDKFANA